MPAQLPQPRHLRCMLAIALLACAPGVSVANTTLVTEWNALSSGPLVAPRFGGPPQQARAAAIVQIAVHDALNAIDPRYQQYNLLRGARNASPEAAVNAAAHQVLHRLIDPMPASQARTDALAAIDATYASKMAQVPDGAAKSAGTSIGVAAADAIADRRANDGSATPNLPYSEPVLAGHYQPTPVLNSSPQAYATPANEGWAQLLPFVIRDGAEYMLGPGALFNLRGRVYAREYNEVKQVGDARIRGAAPDSQESDIARFWPGGGANWNRVLREILAAPALNPALDLDLDLWEQARLFALANIAESDAAIAVFKTKYTYRFWRPVTAIRWADDGNQATTSDPTWWSFMATPAYPDYPCGLTNATGAHTEILRRYFKTDDIAYGFTFNAPAVPLPTPLLPLPAKPITRVFVSLSDAAAESVDARVFGGMHFREGCTKGVQQGERVGRHVFNHALRPLHRRH